MSLPEANFHDLYKKYSGDVYRFAVYLSGDPSRAEDLTSEAFLRIWAAPAPTHLNTVKSYLFAIVRNLHVQNWRIERREAPLDDSPASHPTLDHALDAKAELHRVLTALADIAPLERAALLLRGEQQMSYDDIARLLDISPASARVKVHRARQKLMQFRHGAQHP